MYKCSNCGATMSQPLDSCPNCRVLLSGVKCQACGYLGGKTEFIDKNNHCPRCGSTVNISGAGLSKSPLAGVGWGVFVFILSLLIPGMYRMFTPSRAFYSSKDYVIPLVFIFFGAVIPLAACIDVARRATNKISKVLGWMGVLVIAATCLYGIGIAMTKGRTPFHLSVKVSAAYSPSIAVPGCNSAVDQNDYLCITSEAGDPIGKGKTWIYTDPYMTATMSEIGVYVTVSDTKDKWVLVFNAPEDQPFKGGVFENAVIGYGDPLHPRVNIKLNDSKCRTITGKFEVLELEYLEGTLDSVKQFSVNFEQHCEGKEPALKGYIRFHRTAGP